MDPNSTHQRWSLWVYHVYPDGTKRPDFATVQANCARFGRLIFGSASQMSVQHTVDGAGRPFWEIKIRSEGHPVHDPQYAEWMHQQWRRFFGAGFGRQAEVQVHARLEAGSREEGRPPDQLIIMPTVKLDLEV